MFTESLSCPLEHFCVFKKPPCSFCQVSLVSLIQWVNVFFCGLSKKSRYLQAILWQNGIIKKALGGNCECCNFFFSKRKLMVSDHCRLGKKAHIDKSLAAGCIAEPYSSALAMILTLSWQVVSPWLEVYSLILQDPSISCRGQPDKENGAIIDTRTSLSFRSVRVAQICYLSGTRLYLPSWLGRSDVEDFPSTVVLTIQLKNPFWRLLWLLSKSNIYLGTLENNTGGIYGPIVSV